MNLNELPHLRGAPAMSKSKSWNKRSKHSVQKLSYSSSSFKSFASNSNNRSAVLYKLHFPQFPLSQFVENIWYYNGHYVAHSREKILPDGAIELIIDLDTWPKKIFENEHSVDEYRTVKKAWISGERTRYIV